MRPLPVSQQRYALTARIWRIDGGNNSGIGVEFGSGPMPECSCFRIFLPNPGLAQQKTGVHFRHTDLEPDGEICLEALINKAGSKLATIGDAERGILCQVDGRS